MKPPLVNRRRSPVEPWRVLPSIAALLLQLAELAQAIALALDNDDRWSEAEEALEAAAVWVRAPYDHVARAKARRDLPTSLPFGSKLGAAMRRDQAIRRSERLDARPQLLGRGNQRREEETPGADRDARSRAPSTLRRARRVPR